MKFYCETSLMDTSSELDKIDKHILKLMQTDASQTNQEIADQVGLSPAPCSRRIRRLIETGIIQKQVAIVDRKAVQLDLVAFVGISMDFHTSDRFEPFETAIAKISEVVECYIVTGQKADYILKVVVPNMEAYDKVLLSQINTIPGVNSVHTSFQLRDVFNNRPLPIE